MTRIEMLTRAVKGNTDAAEFLDMLIGVLHLWDDLIDKDHSIPDADIDKAFWKMLVELPRNPFYARNFNYLNPLLMVAIQNWFASNKMERNGSDDDKRIAFILRSSYADLITQSALLVGGSEWAEQITPDIRRFTHAEGYEGYLVNLAEEKQQRENHET